MVKEKIRYLPLSEAIATGKADIAEVIRLISQLKGVIIKKRCGSKYGYGYYLPDYKIVDVNLETSKVIIQPVKHVQLKQEKAGDYAYTEYTTFSYALDDKFEERKLTLAEHRIKIGTIRVGEEDFRCKEFPVEERLCTWQHYYD
jgi:hypothetical protein